MRGGIICNSWFFFFFCGVQSAFSLNCARHYERYKYMTLFTLSSCTITIFNISRNIDMPWKFDYINHSSL